MFSNPTCGALKMAGVIVLALGPLRGEATDPIWINLAVAGPNVRIYHAMAYDSARGVVVLFGGHDANGLNGQTWEWDGTTWTLVDAGDPNGITAPRPREENAMAYDAARGEAVLFGGYLGNNAWSGETWAWDGDAWSLLATTGPSARGAHAMAYDSARGVTVLFGGGSGGCSGCGETWEWDGTTWMQRNPTLSPDPRHSHVMVYDSARGVTVLFGGYFFGSILGDTWEWDGLTWTPRNTPVSPGPRFRLGMAYDAGRGVAVLYGGDDGSPGAPYLADTWEWNGATWTQRLVSGPGVRELHALAYDSARSRVVLFGGQDNSNNYLADTWEYFLDCSANSAPAITQQPASQTACLGSSADFTVAAEGNAPLAFQWRRDGTDIAGANAATLTITSVSVTDAGDYDVVVANTCGTATSAAATLTVQTSPTITVDPSDQAVCQGGSATFSVSATGTPPLSYQWRRDGANIAGATGAAYVIDAAAPADAGQYDAVVTNSCGSVMSAPAALTVDAPPVITAQPTSQSVCAGTQASFSVTADGPSPLSYQWRHNGTDIAGATNPVYAIGAAAPADAGQYQVVVTSICGSVTSAPATLTVAAGAVVTQQPTSQSVAIGDAVTFFVAAVATPAPTYQWRKNTIPITGATGTSYSISSVSFADAGAYDVIATGTCGSVTSGIAVLMVEPPPVPCTSPMRFGALEVGPALGFSIAIADLNGDGNMDLATAGNGTYVLINHGDGSFASINLNVDASAVAVADFDLDGDPDLVVRGGDITVLLNQGDGTFAQGYVIGAFPGGGLAAGDTNGDGYPDVLVGYSNFPLGNAIIVLSNNGDWSAGQGTFTAAGYSYIGYPGPAVSAAAICNGVPFVADTYQGLVWGPWEGSTPHWQYPAGNGQSDKFMASGDLNGDGLDDLAVTSESGNSIAILFWAPSEDSWGCSDVCCGPGCPPDSPTCPTRLLAPAQYYYVGDNLTGVAIGDLNGDGFNDMAVTHGVPAPVNGHSQVSILLNDGFGVFTVADSYFAGANVRGVVIADFDGDSIPDLAVTSGDPYPQNWGLVGVTFLRGRGDGSFEAAVPYEVPGSPRAIAIDDLDGDGIGDVVVGNGDGPGQISILRGQSDGTLSPPSSYPLANVPRALAVADLNGDTHRDVAAIIPWNYTVVVLLNLGNGALAAPVSYSVGAEPVAVAAADMDGDQDVDLVVLTHDSGDVSVFLNNGDGTFAPAMSYALSLPGSPETMVVADFNGDGRPDVIATANGAFVWSSSLLWNNGDGTLAAPVGGPASGYWTSPPISAADLDGDGDFDLVFGGTYTGNWPFVFPALHILRNNGNGTFAPATDDYFPVWGPSSLTFADLNGDGAVDIVVGNNSNSNVTLFMNKGDGTFSLESHAVGPLPQYVAVGDIDGDGDIDIAAANYGSFHSISVLLNQSDHAGSDCDGNGVPDDCELAGRDCNANGVLDACELAGNDCDGNGVLDECQTAPGIVSVSIPTDSMDGTCWPLDFGIWDDHAPANGPLNIISGIGYLVNPTQQGLIRFSLHDHHYIGDYVPDPARAVVTYEFDRPVVVDQVEIVQHSNGITQIEGFVGNSLTALTSIGAVFGPSGDVMGSNVLPNGQPQVFEFNNTQAGRFFKFIIRKTSASNGYASYRAMPRNAQGTRYLGVLSGFGDCDGNGVPDACEPDGNGNGVPDVCDPNIVSANPPAVSPYGAGVFRDVLQNMAIGPTPQGIGVPGTPDEGPYTFAPISVTFSGAPSPAPTPANIIVSCTDIAVNGQADCPSVASVTPPPAGGATWMIQLTAPPPPRECTTLMFAGTAPGQKLQYQSLPGDVNLDGAPNPLDLLWLVQRLNDGTANVPANLARYNVDRSSGASPVNVGDLLRIVQLLNGVNTTQVFNGATVAPCSP